MAALPAAFEAAAAALHACEVQRSCSPSGVSTVASLRTALQRLGELLRVVSGAADALDDAALARLHLSTLQNIASLLARDFRDFRRAAAALAEGLASWDKWSVRPHGGRLAVHGRVAVPSSLPSGLGPAMERTIGSLEMMLSRLGWCNLADGGGDGDGADADVSLPSEIALVEAPIQIRVGWCLAWNLMQSGSWREAAAVLHVLERHVRPRAPPDLRGRSSHNFAVLDGVEATTLYLCAVAALGGSGGSGGDSGIHNAGSGGRQQQVDDDDDDDDDIEAPGQQAVPAKDSPDAAAAAMAFLARSLAVVPAFGPSLLLQGTLLLRSGEFCRAVVVLRRCATRLRGNSAALCHCLLGHALVADKSYHDAIAAFRAALRIDFASNLEAVFNIASIYGRLDLRRSQSQMLTFLVEGATLQRQRAGVGPASAAPLASSSQGGLIQGTISPSTHPSTTSPSSTQTVDHDATGLRLAVTEGRVRIEVRGQRNNRQGTCCDILTWGHAVAGRVAADEGAWDTAARHFASALQLCGESSPSLFDSAALQPAPAIAANSLSMLACDAREQWYRIARCQANVALQRKRPKEALGICCRLRELTGSTDISVLMMQADALLNDGVGTVDDALGVLSDAAQSLSSRVPGEAGLAQPALGELRGFRLDGLSTINVDTWGGSGSDGGRGDTRLLNAVRAQVKNNQALCLVCKRQTDEAAALFRSAIDLDPSAVQPIFNLSVMLWSLGRRMEASAAWLEFRGWLSKNGTCLDVPVPRPIPAEPMQNHVMPDHQMNGHYGTIRASQTNLLDRLCLKFSKEHPATARLVLS